jgi:hypothetical protein
MDKIIIEKASSCKLVRHGSERDGHGAFGEPEYSHYKYVVINGKTERVHGERFIVHDGEKVLSVEYALDDELLVHLDDELNRKKMKRRYKDYIELKEEFDNIGEDDLKYLRRDVTLKKIVGAKR